MKKEYITPDMDVIEINTSSAMLLSASMGLDDSDTEWDTSGGEQGGRNDRPSNPNLWEQSW